MPICPRCGKSLSSEQALSYHLNRKYRCGTWKCISCMHVYDTKLQLQLHEMKCCTQQRDYPDYHALRLLYDNSPNLLCEIDNNIVIRSNKDTFIGVNVTHLKEYIFKNDNVCIM
jgi:hypothetical protein